jgi:uncharacterized membrane protein required for colicin V production
VRGVFRETMGLAGVVLGGVGAAAFWQPGSAFLQRALSVRPLTGQILAAVLIFTAVNLIAHLAAIVGERAARLLFLGGVMRLAGAIVGLGKGAAILGFALLLLRSYAPLPGVTQAIGASSLGEPLTEVAESVLRLGTGLLQPLESRGV